MSKTKSLWGQVIGEEEEEEEKEEEEEEAERHKQQPPSSSSSSSSSFFFGMSLDSRRRCVAGRLVWKIAKYNVSVGITPFYQLNYVTISLHCPQYKQRYSILCT